MEFENENFRLAKESAVVATYFFNLGINWEMLKGKRVLDLGSGLGKFAKEAKAQGIDIVSLDKNPDWHSADWINDVQTDNFVKGDAFSLPFANNSFDIILARASVHSIIETRDDLEDLLSEILRVLKKGGQFRFGPGGLVFEYLNEKERQEYIHLIIDKNQGTISTLGLQKLSALEEIRRKRFKQMQELVGDIAEYDLETDEAKNADFIKKRTILVLQNILKDTNARLETYNVSENPNPYLNYYFKITKLLV